MSKRIRRSSDIVFPGLDAEHHLVGSRVGLAQIVGVVGRDQRDSGVAGQLVDQRHYDLVFLEFVVLNLQEEVLFPEDIGVLVGEAAWLRRTSRS